MNGRPIVTSAVTLSVWRMAKKLAMAAPKSFPTKKTYRENLSELSL